MSTATTSRVPLRGARVGLGVLLGTALTITALPFAAAAQDEGDAPPGPVADRLLFTQFDVDRAPLDIEAGNMDIYLFGLKTDAARDLVGTEGVELIEAPATSLSLILNPAPDPAGGLNPFSIPEVRRIERSPASVLSSTRARNGATAHSSFRAESAEPRKPLPKAASTSRFPSAAR